MNSTPTFARMERPSGRVRGGEAHELPEGRDQVHEQADRRARAQRAARKDVPGRVAVVRPRERSRGAAARVAADELAAVAERGGEPELEESAGWWGRGRRREGGAVGDAEADDAEQRRERGGEGVTDPTSTSPRERNGKELIFFARVARARSRGACRACRARARATCFPEKRALGVW
eukprot:30835-Pelagococcus_subviridis.AAC.8